MPLICSKFSTQSRRFARQGSRFQSNSIDLSCRSSGFSWPSLVQRKAVLWSQLWEENQKDATISQLAKEIPTQRFKNATPSQGELVLEGAALGMSVSTAMFWHLKHNPTRLRFRSWRWWKAHIPPVEYSVPVIIDVKFEFPSLKTYDGRSSR